MAQAGISTLGVRFSYGVGGNSKDGAKPSTMNILDRINSIGEINIEPEKIDASALEDLVARYVAGRSDTGGSCAITVNTTNETIEQWTTLIGEYNAIAESSSSAMWFQVTSPYLEKSFWFIAQPPQAVPQPSIEQNGLYTMTINLTIVDYVGLSAKVEPTAHA